jgi:hypothetical protein
VEPPSQEEKVSGERFGVSSSVLERAGHLRDTIFPQAGVRLYIAQQQAYAVTEQQAFIRLGPLQALTEMTDGDVLQTLDRALYTYHHQKRSLLELRIQARFFTQPELARFINERFATPSKPSIISPRTIWRAENGYPIAKTTALLIVEALQERGIQVTVEQIDWVIGQQGKRGGSTAKSSSSSC